VTPRWVSDEPLSVQEHLDAVSDPASGAVALFVGRVRDHDPSVSGAVTGLDYTAHPDASDTLERLVATASVRPGVLGVAATHRIGLVGVGEAAVVVAVATAHRTLAFQVCAELVETVKRELPVWKREILADGSHVWVGLE